MSELPQINSVHASQTARVMPRQSEKTPLASWINAPFLIVIGLLVCYGLIVCWSATCENEKFDFTRQVYGVLIGLVLMAVVWRFDYRRLAGLTTPLLVLNVILILSPHLPVIGVETNGAQSWIKIGIQLQPGELAKVTVVLFAASLLARYQGELDDLKEYCKVVVLLLIPLVCIMTQPDLGTGLVYLAISAAVLVMGGAKARYLVGTLVAGIIAIVCVFALDEVLKYETSPGEYEYRILKNYQRNRLLVFLNPDDDLSDAGYNLAQAKIAIGSGGLLGKGLRGATQSTHGFLPEAPTDFIFCVLAEELGFVGVVLLLALYAALLFMCIRMARESDTLFGMLICMGAVGMWLFQILENIGMDCGLMPITGIPLPFVSYGSSSMTVNFVLLGLIGSVWSHKSTAVRKGA